MNNKASIKLQGGLGNMLFQIACTYSYSKKNNKELFLSKEKTLIVHNNIESYQDNILSKIIFSKDNIKFDSNYTEPVFHYNEIPNLNGNVFLANYFQSEKYFKDQENEIRELFSFECKISDEIKELLETKNTCSIHVRRGDYLKSPSHHPTQNMNYYMKAIKQMPKDSVFLIFSDDIEWCKNNFPDLPEKFIFVGGNKDYEDLYIMSRCTNNIICNSTFSWWGAWLNKNDEKIVVAPSEDKWFGPAYSNYNTKDLYCEGWIKI